VGDPADVPAGDLLDEVARRVRERFDPTEADRAEDLVRDYYRRVGTLDLAGRSPTELYGAAVSHLQLARRRPPGHHLVRVYDPSVDDDGWRSAHTVVDVVTDDMPFLVASIRIAVERAGGRIHLLVHPVLSVRRDHDLLIGSATAATGPGVQLRESFVHVEIDRLTDPDRAEHVRAAVDEALTDVRGAVADWREMTGRAHEVAAALALDASAAPPVGSPADHGPTTDPAEISALVRWMAEDEFVFLGYRRYRLDPAEGVIRSVPDTGLGVLRGRPATAHPLTDLTPAGAARVLGPDRLLITKTNQLSTVHRPDPLDYVGIRHIDTATGVITEDRFLGLFTSRAYTETVTRLPLVRVKVREILRQAGFPAGSHNANQLLTVLEELPRDELLQAGVDELLGTAVAIVHLLERRDVRLFLRTEAFGRFTSCLVFLPRDRFRTEVREAVERLLLEALGGSRTSYTAAFTSSPLARIHVTVHTPEGGLAAPDVDDLEAQVARLTRTWADELERALVEAAGEGPGLALAARYGGAFPAGYREDVVADAAVSDIVRLEALGADGHVGGDLAVRLHRSVELPPDSLRCRLYRAGRAIALSDVLPLLQSHGASVMDERPYSVRPHGAPRAWIYDFGLRFSENIVEHISRHRELLEESILATWDGRAEIDRLNELVATAGLTWREVALLRAYRRYLRQIGSTFSEDYVSEVVTRHAGVARLLVDLFHHRLHPARRDGELAVEIDEWITDALDAVPNLDEDRILRGARSLVLATVRTSFHRVAPDGAPPDTIAVKLDPALVPDLPAPRPAHEVFVSSPRVEGVHLRAGRVARGGIRWSDRKEDFRTEILGLMKAQVVKNALIVPTGAKGGFVCRRLPADDAGARAEVTASYRAFIDALLDVTDDLVDSGIVPPADVTRLDGDDPYLVVAADKGTATFSDLANELAVRRGFWLGDAFASGGSTGYDHKEMGITARGAWVSVRRHLRELGLRVEHDEITAVGIGDMSGDVFGNGMLLSRRLRLVAAFDHRHVFIDPDPDPEASWAERRRLFELPRSSWADYDRAVLSPGGIIVPRSAKAVTITPAGARALGIDHGELTPNELVRAVLRAPVDLLWNGGIGTYVKASAETHADAADRANDAVRVDASELRCRVVGEGGNLGFTQRARIELARAGGRINTDAIDNSAGVDCSDHEVNLKVLLDQVVRAGELTVRQRDALLVEATDEVAALVLAGNEAQTLALTTARTQAPEMTDVHARHLRWLERHGGLDRALEALPTDAALAERRDAGIGLTQPELAVVLAYTKNVVSAALLDSRLPDDPDVAEELVAYVPTVIAHRFPDDLRRHPLRRELVATGLTNRMVDRAGISMVLRLQEETSAAVADIVAAHVAAWRTLDLDELWSAAIGLPDELDPATRSAMLLEVKRLGERATRWILRNRRSPIEIGAVVAEMRTDVGQVLRILPEVAAPHELEELAETSESLAAAGVPEPLRSRIAALPVGSAALDLVETARHEGAPLELATRVHVAAGAVLELGWLRSRVDALPRDDRWTYLARSALRDDLTHEHATLVGRILAAGGDEPAEDRVARWASYNRPAVERFRGVLAELRGGPVPGLAQLTVALREVRNLIHQAGTPPIAFRSEAE